MLTAGTCKDSICDASCMYCRVEFLRTAYRVRWSATAARRAFGESPACAPIVVVKEMQTVRTITTRTNKEKCTLLPSSFCLRLAVLGKRPHALLQTADIGYRRRSLGGNPYVAFCINGSSCQEDSGWEDRSTPYRPAKSNICQRSDRPPTTRNRQMWLPGNK